MRPGPLFLNNRYHDPTLGTFISVDPLVTTTGEPYIYASGNPTTLSDPTGLEPGCGPNSPAGLCRSSHTGDACADTSYYQCGTAEAGPKAGQTRTLSHAYGPRALDEFDRGIGIDPSRWCHVNGSRPFSHGCGAPPETGEYARPGQVYAVLDYLSQYGGYVADGAAGGVDGATVSVAGYTTARGTTVLSYTRYRAGLADFGNGIAPAGKLTVGTRWVGRAFVALQAGVTAFDSWRATEEHSAAYRLSYTAVKTVVTTGGALAGASGGASGGLAIGCWGGPWGCAIGGAVGGVGGGIVGYIVADEVTDWVWNYTYERVAG